MGRVMLGGLRVAVVGALVFAGWNASAGRIIDEIVATVDTEPILMSDILLEIGPQADEIRASSASETEYNQAMDDLVNRTLEQAIDNRILVREARLAGYSLPADAVENRLNEYRKLFDSPEAFQRQLDESGEAISDLRDRLGKQLLAVGMAERKQEDFKKGVVVSESEVAQYYQDHIEEFQHDARVRVHQIFLAAPNDSAQRELTRARMESLKEELAAGAGFEELAIEYSEAPGAEAGGVIGWVQQGDLKGTLNDAAFSLEEGEVSGVLESDGGLHLLKVTEKDPAGTISLEEARKQIEPELRRMEAAERFDQWMAELRKRSRVKVFL